MGYNVKKNASWKTWSAVVIASAAVLVSLASGAAAQAHAQSDGASHARGVGAAPGVAGRSTVAASRVNADAESAPTVAANGVVNLNTATNEELERLPGIGPSKAQAILALRQRTGRFARVEDVLRVRGIGRATFRRLRPMLVLTGQTTLTERPARARARSEDADEQP